MIDYFARTCCVCCRSDALENGTNHSITDMDGCTWVICNDCWKRIKEVMNKEDTQ